MRTTRTSSPSVRGSNCARRCGGREARPESDGRRDPRKPKSDEYLMLATPPPPSTYGVSHLAGPGNSVTKFVRKPTPRPSRGPYPHFADFEVGQRERLELEADARLEPIADRSRPRRCLLPPSPNTPAIGPGDACAACPGRTPTCRNRHTRVRIKCKNGKSCDINASLLWKPGSLIVAPGRRGALQGQCPDGNLAFQLASAHGCVLSDRA